MTHITDILNKDISYFEFDIFSTILAYEIYKVYKSESITKKSLFEDKDVYNNILNIEDAYTLSKKVESFNNDSFIEYMELVYYYCNGTHKNEDSNMNMEISLQKSLYGNYLEALINLENNSNKKQYKTVNTYLYDIDNYENIVNNLRMSCISNMEFSKYTNSNSVYNLGYINLNPEFWPLVSRLLNVLYDGVAILEYTTAHNKHRLFCGKKRSEMEKEDINKILKNLS